MKFIPWNIDKSIGRRQIIIMTPSLVFFGNETLKSIAEEIINIDQDVISLIESMYKIMYRAKGIGLAAPQVDVSKRLIILDIEDSGGPSLTLINPVIKESSDMTEPYEEGCLSVPGVNADIIRPSEVLVTGITPEGKETEIEASGLLARVLQHEIDHLNGILFIDYLESYERNELRPHLKKLKKLNAM
jgi:peptide deformylase